MAKKQEYQVGFPIDYSQNGAQNGYPQGMQGMPNGYNQYGFPQNGYPQGDQQSAPPAEEKEPKKKEVKTKVKYLPRSFLWNIVGLCLAFFFGIFACLGAIVGAVAIVSKRASVQKTFSFIGKDAGQYVSEAYLDKSILDLAGDLMNDARGGSLNTLDAVGKYTPLVKSTLDKVAAQLADMGIAVNTEELMGVEFSSLGSYMTDNVLMTTQLGSVLKLTGESSKLMLGVCYGAEGEDYTVTDGKIVMNEGKHATTVKDLADDAEGVIGRIEIGAALNVTASSEAAIRYIAYGSEGVDYDITDGQIVMRTGKKSRTISSLSDADADVVGGARIRDLVTLDDNSSDLMKAVSDWKISDLTNGYKIKRLKIGQLFTMPESPSPFLAAMKDWRIEEMTEGGKLDTVTLGDLISVSDASPDVVKALQDTPMCELSSRIDTLRLSSVLGESGMNGNKLLKNLKNSTLKTLPDDIAALTVEDVFGSDVYAYISLVKSGGKTYEQLLTQYQSTGKNSPTLSENVPKPIPADAAVKTGYVMKANTGSFVTEAYFLNNTIVDEADVYRTAGGYATRVKTKVEPVYEWKIVDYAAGALATPPADVEIREEDGEVWYFSGDTFCTMQEDTFGNYVTDDGERIDFEHVIVGYKLGGNTYAPVKGQITVDGVAYTVYTDETQSYIEREQPVTKAYASQNGTKYAENQVTVKYTASWTDDDGTHTDEAVDRYLSGVWYLLFSKSAQGAKVPLEDVATYVTDAQSVLTDAKLWQLYFHGIINENPYRDLSGSVISGATGNLNDYTIDGIIGLLKNV